MTITGAMRSTPATLTEPTAAKSEPVKCSGKLKKFTNDDEMFFNRFKALPFLGFRDSDITVIKDFERECKLKDRQEKKSKRNCRFLRWKLFITEILNRPLNLRNQNSKSARKAAAEINNRVKHPKSGKKTVNKERWKRLRMHEMTKTTPDQYFQKNPPLFSEKAKVGKKGFNWKQAWGKVNWDSAVIDADKIQKLGIRLTEEDIPEELREGNKWVGIVSESIESQIQEWPAQAYEKQLEKWEKSGLVMETYDVKHICKIRLHPKPKRPGEWRFIIDCLGPNQNQPPPTKTQARSPTSLTEIQMKQTSIIYTEIGDVESGFYNIEIPPSQQRIFGLPLTANGRSFRWKALPMGWKWSPKLFEKALQKDPAYELITQDKELKENGMIADVYVDDIWGMIDGLQAYWDLGAKLLAVSKVAWQDNYINKATMSHNLSVKVSEIKHTKAYNHQPRGTQEYINIIGTEQEASWICAGFKAKVTVMKKWLNWRNWANLSRKQKDILGGNLEWLAGFSGSCWEINKRLLNTTSQWKRSYLQKEVVMLIAGAINRNLNPVVISELKECNRYVKTSHKAKINKKAYHAAENNIIGNCDVLTHNLRQHRGLEKYTRSKDKWQLMSGKWYFSEQWKETKELESLVDAGFNVSRLIRTEEEENEERELMSRNRKAKEIRDKVWKDSIKLQAVEEINRTTNTHKSWRCFCYPIWSHRVDRRTTIAAVLLNYQLSPNSTFVWFKDLRILSKKHVKRKLHRFAQLDTNCKDIASAEIQLSMFPEREEHLRSIINHLRIEIENTPNAQELFKWLPLVFSCPFDCVASRFC